MHLSPLGTSIVGGLLAVITFLQLEQTGLSHPLHIAITAVAVFLGVVFVNPPKKAEP